jgi:gamma-glutamylcyclotransferase (GGCT)/AIG2-like uncharacterized protein YtfP
MSEHIFVYGTLRSESTHPMAARLRTGAKLIGKGKTAGLLYDLGAYPGAVFASGERRHVIGEVFRFGANAKLLAELDSYEGITGAKDDMWARVLVEVGLDHGGIVEAWAYGLTAVPRARVIGTGDFIADRRLRTRKAATP